MCYERKDTRGIKYGTDVNKLSAIKPYTQSTYGRNIPLMTENIPLPLRDSYKMNSSVVIIQDTPFPAFIRNLTLETQYGNKN